MSKEYIEKAAVQLYAENIREYLNELFDSGWLTITNVDWRVLMSFILAVNDLPLADVVTRDCFDKILAENDTMRDQLYCIGKYPGDSMKDVAAVVRGEWKWNDDNGYYYCSECGAVSPREDQDGEYIDCPHYCHNCGADMRKEEDE